MTVGRCGSTALMQTLQDFPDIATPNKNISCVDNELLHPEHIGDYAKQYERLSGYPIRSPGQLIRAFYTHNGNCRYAGFKSMPNRHRHFEQFAFTPGIQFITLTRLDIPSTVASFVIAMLTGCWRREGGLQEVAWRFDEAQFGDMVAANLRYVLDSLNLIQGIPQAIALTYEDICRKNFMSLELDDFFERPIRLAHPKPPLHAETYVVNWLEFLEFVTRSMESYRRDASP
jgi:hypothetical protein